MKNVVFHNYQIDIKERRALLKQNSFLIWFTGLSGSGKSTIANLLDQKLYNEGYKSFTLDGDNIRSGMNKDLSFSHEDRTENIRRISELSNLFVEAGLIVIAAFVSPYEKDRENIKEIVKPENYIEIFVNTSIEECERRDVKGLYKKAREGEIKDFTGINAPYEKPQNPDITINTENESCEEAVERIFRYIKPKLKNG